jgi:hypothetical protein
VGFSNYFYSQQCWGGKVIKQFQRDLQGLHKVNPGAVVEVISFEISVCIEGKILKKEK